MDQDIWLSLRQASDMTGKSINALRILVNRRRFDMVKREERNGRTYWLIHRDSLVKTCGNDMGGTYPRQEHVGQHVADTCQVNTITFDAYEEKRSEWQKERDELQAGLLMYRYKFEELDRQTRLLPAPLESIPSKLAELETKSAESTAQAAEDKQALARSQETVKALEEALQRERQRTWWDRLWKKG